MDFQSSQNGMYDPSSFIDPSAIAGNQMNGTRPYPMSSIPQKRDSTGATMSRSQTPSQQPQFGGFQPGFAHTPSPTMQNQHFRPGQMPPQRMQTASPAQNPHAPQMSPMNFAQGSPMGQGFDPNAGGQFPVQPMQSIQLSQNLQHKQQEAQRAYAMRLQAQQQQLGNLAASNMAAQQRHQAGQTPGAPGQRPGMQPQLMPGQQMQNPQANPQTFIKNVHSLMAQNRRPFNPQPQVAGRSIDLFNLYSIVIKFRGSRNVTTNNAWPRIAQHLGIPVPQFPTAPEELRQAYEANLGLYEQMYIRSKTQQEQMKMNPMAQMGQMGQQMGQQMSPTRNSMTGAPNAAAAAAQQEYMQQLQRKQMQQQAQRQSDAGLQQQQQFEQPVQQPQSTPLQTNATPALANGRSTPQADGNLVGQHRKSMSRPLEGTPTPSSDPAQPSGTPIKAEPDAAATQSALEQKRHIEEEEDGIYYRPATNLTIKNTWGVLELSDELVQEVSKKLHWMPNVPELREMGVVDIRALTMSLRSGLHAETRLALDTLSKLTHENNIQLDLEQCDDLVDVLAEYAEDQLEILGTDNPEVTDIIELMSYEDILHNCQTEVNTLQDLPEFGSKAYDLDRTADRVLAITSIIRNLSFLEINHARLSSPPVLKFLSNAIRLVGTRMLFLRSYIHTLDFMKDLITFFSNSSTRIALPSREDAYAVLHFLCAFAPSPRPGLPVRFTSYNPKVHRYLPSAVDSMAKLLAIDDPNRTYYKQIFINEATSDPPYDLLTRAFALAIAVVPDRTEGKLHDLAETRPKEVQHYEARVAEARKPYLMQGMLAADILASLAPGPESGVCRSWLEAEDGWANSLLKFAMSLCSLDARMQQPPPQPNHRGQRPMEQDREGYHLIVNRALSMIKRLGDKSKGADALIKSVETNGTGYDNEEDDWADDMEELDVGGTTWKVKADILPRKETVLGALLMHQLDARALRQFCGLGYLAEN